MRSCRQTIATEFERWGADSTTAIPVPVGSISDEQDYPRCSSVGHHSVVDDALQAEIGRRRNRRSFEGRDDLTARPVQSLYV